MNKKHKRELGYPANSAMRSALLKFAGEIASRANAEGGPRVIDRELIGPGDTIAIVSEFEGLTERRTLTVCEVFRMHGEVADIVMVYNHLGVAVAIMPDDIVLVVDEGDDDE